MSVCLECARRCVWNSEPRVHQWDPVECEECQAKGVGCEHCEDAKLRTGGSPVLCFDHALEASKRKAEQKAAIKDVVQAALNLRERTRQVMVAPYFQAQLDALCEALARLD